MCVYEVIYVCVFPDECSTYSICASIYCKLCCILYIEHIYVLSFSKFHVYNIRLIFYTAGEFRQAIVLIEKGLRLVRTREETQDLYQLYLMTKAQADALDVLQSTQ